MNGKLQTSNPDIYAIGDVAAFPLHNYGLNKMFRQEHVANCRQSAKHAGAASTSCDSLPARPVIVSLLVMLEVLLAKTPARGLVPALRPGQLPPWTSITVYSLQL